MTRLIVLDLSDHVATVLCQVAAGEWLEGLQADKPFEVQALEAIPMCHKIALVDLKPGDPVFKYGAMIGCAVVEIRRGSHVHVHNLTSQRARSLKPATRETDARGPTA